jgi:hypothetical protein
MRGKAPEKKIAQFALRLNRYAKFILRSTSMIKRNPCMANIRAGYLFPEVARRRREFAASAVEREGFAKSDGQTSPAAVV